MFETLVSWLSSAMNDLLGNSSVTSVRSRSLNDLSTESFLNLSFGMDITKYKLDKE